MSNPTIRITERLTRDGRFLGIRFMGALYEEFGPDPSLDYVRETAYALADKYAVPHDKIIIPENLKP